MALNVIQQKHCLGGVDNREERNIINIQELSKGIQYDIAIIYTGYFVVSGGFVCKSFACKYTINCRL